jgi:hypothetical protein
VPNLIRDEEVEGSNPTRDREEPGQGAALRSGPSGRVVHATTVRVDGVRDAQGLQALDYFDNAWGGLLATVA